MALTADIIKLKVEMDRGATVPVFSVFQDQTDYDAAGVTVANVKGYLSILVNGVSYYNNSNLADPDINGGSTGQTNEDLLRSRTQSTQIPLPLDIDGVPINGQYRFVYTVKDGVDTVFAAIVMDCTFDKPTGKLTSVLDLTPTNPSISVTDETNYIVQNVTPTGTPTLTLYYPGDSGQSPTSVSASNLEIITFWTGQQVAKLSAEKTWDYSNKIVTSATFPTATHFTSGNFTLHIVDTVTAREEIDVEVNNNICALFCCLKEFATKLRTAKSRPSQYAQLRDIAGQVAFYYNSIDAAYQCSDTTSVNIWVQEIRELVGCNDDCDCKGDTPVQISGIASGSLVLGNVIKFVTSGTTTSYQNNALINSTYNDSLQSFQVYAEGNNVEGTHNSTTGAFTPTYSWATGMQIKIVRLRP